MELFLIILVILAILDFFFFAKLRKKAPSAVSLTMQKV